MRRTNPKRAWSVADAKAQFSKVIDRALSMGPQIVTRHGRRVAVIVSADDWNRKMRHRGTLVEFLAASPLRDSGLDTTRVKDRPPDVEL